MKGYYNEGVMILGLMVLIFSMMTFFVMTMPLIDEKPITFI